MLYRNRGGRIPVAAPRHEEAALIPRDSCGAQSVTPAPCQVAINVADEIPAVYPFAPVVVNLVENSKCEMEWKRKRRCTHIFLAQTNKPIARSN